jgi:hypothetical protein
MTYVVCRCGHGFETRAVAGRTTCGACKKAVSVPKPPAEHIPTVPAGDTGDTDKEGSNFGLGIALGLVAVIWGVWALRQWNELRSKPDEDNPWRYGFGGAVALVGGGALVFYCGKRIVTER